MRARETLVFEILRGVEPRYERGNLYNTRRRISWVNVVRIFKEEESKIDSGPRKY